MKRWLSHRSRDEAEAPAQDEDWMTVRLQGRSLPKPRGNRWIRAGRTQFHEANDTM